MLARCNYVAASALIIFAVIAEVPIQFDRGRNLARRTNCRRRVSEFVYLRQTREIAPRAGRRRRGWKETGRGQR